LKPAGNLRETCGKPAGNLRETCGKPAGNLRETCGKPAGNLRETYRNLLRTPSFNEKKYYKLHSYRRILSIISELLNRERSSA
jgi:hypothetical protein